MCYFLWEKIIIIGIAIKFTNIIVENKGRESSLYEYISQLLRRIPPRHLRGISRHGRGSRGKVEKIENGRMEGEVYKDQNGIMEWVIK